MRAGRAVAAAAVAILWAVAPAGAHHAIGSVVDTSKTQQNMMVLTKVDWINPHAWFHFTVKQPNGTLLRDVMVEWLSLAGMRRAGYASADVFAVGTTYKVTYNPNRDGSPGGHLVKMISGKDGVVFQR